MKSKKSEKTLANEAAKPRTTRHGPAPEMFKIDGYKNWGDAVTVALRKPKPSGGWPK
jgi:hypothetical protein